MQKTTTDPVLDLYGHMTLAQLLDRYDSPGAEPCPVELAAWIVVAREARDVDELRAEVRELRGELGLDG